MAEQILKFESFFSTSEKEANPFHLDPHEFLKNHKSQLNKLKKAITRIKFNFKGEFIVDLTMPSNVGGYFSPDQGILAISPFILMQGTEQQIAHILFHEGLHAGSFGPQVLEESITESLTKKKMGELYGKQEFKSGYDDMVDDLNELTGEMSYAEMSEQIENGDEETFNNFLQIMITDPAYNEEDIASLSWDEIRKKLNSKWGLLKKLFPRIMNSLSGKNYGIHDAAHLSLSEFKLDDVLEQSAKKILSKNPEMLNSIFETVSNEAKQLKEYDILQAMIDKGFGYLIDTDRNFVERKLREFIFQKSLQNLAEFTQNLQLSI